jgi:penicillin amidase
VLRGLQEGKAPGDLAKWRYGSIHTLDVEHPIFDQSQALRDLLGRRTGTGVLPQSGDGTTVKQVGHSFGPSERYTADLSDLDHSTLNIVLGESSNPDSPWFMDQFQAWYRGTTFALPFSQGAVNSATTHTLTLMP